MKVTDLPIQGLKLIELKIFHDNRGFFVERFNEKSFRDLGLPVAFVQDNHSRSAPRVLRGLHFQSDPAQSKLVGAMRGRIWDIAVDIRPASPTYGQHYGTELSDENGRLLWIPAGFAHGFCVLGDEPADVVYKVDGLYNPKTDGGIRWDDPDLMITWPVKDPIVSEKDARLPSFAEYRKNPPRWA
jgi:dTDP-4-dehydrorhamnose 3,5-epimerase